LQYDIVQHNVDKPKAINISVVLRLAEHILALPVTGLIITTSVLQYGNILWTSCMQYAICQYAILYQLYTTLQCSSRRYKKFHLPFFTFLLPFRLLHSSSF